ncbi:hypothetical protein B484DRAFT_398912 [Ochromonadaceae sp. CCMP2298]|nr:hypothetical protein B484DRAFT_398912 [Ochromonadaceae sp. CCMP2298]
MFQDLSSSEKRALHVLVNLNLSTEVCAFAVDDVSSEKRDDDEELGLRNCWSDELLRMLAEELQLSASRTSAYLPLILSTANAFKSIDGERHELCAPYVAVLLEDRLTAAALYIKLFVFLIISRKYDGRGRVAMRNLMHTLDLPAREGVWIECTVMKYLKEQEQGGYLFEKKKDSHRMTKIGTVAVGVGMALALAGAVCAPFIAVGINAIGISAYGISWLSMALIFGSAGAGLSGYRMLKRTRGLTEFYFKQYDDKGKMAVMLMVPGWIGAEEDEKRTFGVLPEKMSLRERVERYYAVHAPERVPLAAEECEAMEGEPEQLLHILGEKFGLDPTLDEHLIPPPMPVGGWGYPEIVAECFAQVRRAAEQRGESQSRSSRREGGEGGESGKGFGFSGSFNDTDPVGMLKETVGTAGTGIEAGAGTVGESEYSHKAGESEYHNLRDLMAVSEPNPGAVGHVEGWDGRDVDVEVDDVDPDVDVDVDAELRQLLAQHGQPTEDQMKYWHWRELDISPVYELTLLHWETTMLRELGRSMTNMYVSMGYYTTELVVTSLPVFWLLATAAMFPVAMLEMTASIDNQWTIACERADAAGIELARALLLRKGENRPVTLVGYSMGARVIFSCLQHLARLLPECAEAAKVGTGMGMGRDEQGSVTINKLHAISEDGGDGGDMGGEAWGWGGEGQVRVCGGVEMEDVSSIGVQMEGRARGGKEAEVDVGTGIGDGDRAGTRAGTGTQTGRGEAVLGRERGAEPEIEAEAEAEEQSASDSNLNTVQLKGLVQDVVLLGAPLDLHSKHWANIRALVPGRLVNGYSTKDIILSIVYRYERSKLSSTSGLEPVQVAGIENVDLTHIVTKHIHYCTRMQEILAEIDLASPARDPIYI